ncbi:MAG: class I SAM-dependent methyltransferase [Phycisphaerales bacterium]|nr:class I SAM-dependent methyltransferase [Phycisphaerales bacterium]
MKRDALPLLRDPLTGARLELEVFESRDGEIIEALLTSPANWYPVSEGVPRLLTGDVRGDDSAFLTRHRLHERLGVQPRPASTSTQVETNKTFSDKWRRFRNYGFEAEHQKFLGGWFVKKFGLSSPDELPPFYRQFRSILEIGPGSGFNTRFMAEHCAGTVMSVDISEAADTTYGNVGAMPNVHVVQADCNLVPCEDGVFDFAIADGVLHHTPNTREAVANVLRKVRPGGQFFFYVYKQMGAARRFCDRHLREHLSPLEPEDCYAACEGITELGRELSRLNATVRLEKGIPLLGIPPGEHNVQRLLYYNFLKCFWNDAFDWETNNMVNFDWYHPHDAWQHTEEEVRGWLADLGVRDYAIHDANPNGISVLLLKPE